MATETPQERDQRIGTLALKRGRITPLELQAILQAQREAADRGEYRPVGALLVESGKLTREDLEKLLAEQTRSWEGQRVVGRYRLLAKIGEGGMGAVWKAQHVDLGNTVAIKLLPYSVVGDERLVQRFQREARLMASINHSNVLQAFDAGEQNGQPYFVMPYLEGASVGAIVRQCGRLGPRTLLSIALQIVRGLQYAHQRGMIHRDLKPDNLFIGNDGAAKILDLGLAKLIEGSESLSGPRPTQTGMIVGTPQYMSPEQIQGDPNLDARSDIYSLGATFFHMATGRLPFPGRNVPEVLRLKHQNPTPDPFDAVPEIHPGVRRLILSMMAAQPERRPADGLTLEAEIEALLEGKPVTGASLAPASIVMGQSERDTRTFSLGDSRAGIPRETAVVVKSPPGHESSVTTMIPRKKSEPAPAPSSLSPGGRGVGGEAATNLPSAASAKPSPTESTQDVLKAELAAQPSRPAYTPHTKAIPVPVAEPPAPVGTPGQEPPRVQASLFAQIVAAVILVIVTVLATLAVVKMQSGTERRKSPPPGGTPGP